MTVSFIIPQMPKGKARHSTVVTLRCDRCQRTVKGQRSECPYCQNKKLCFLFSNEYTPAEQKEYERFVAMCAQQGMQGRNKFVGACGLWLKFCFAIPESRKKKLKEGDWHPQRPDRDNSEKSIMDGCNGVVWADDCVVCLGMQACVWTEGVPRTEATVISLDEIRFEDIWRLPELEAGYGQPVGG